MGKNDGASKKTVQKQKQKIIEDKTFGLKNKNKSKKVQQQIQGIEKNVMNSGDPKLRKLEEQRKQAKEEAKIRRKQMQAEQEALFGEALLAIQKKSTSQKDGKVEAKGRDAEDDAKNKKGTSAAMKMMYQMDAQEMDIKLKEDPNYVPTIEDEIEMERQKVLNELKAAGKVGTPVTPDTFAIWNQAKKLKRQEEIKKRVETEFKKKKGGKGLSVLSGRDLYEYKKELFNKFDDDNDVDDAMFTTSISDGTGYNTATTTTLSHQSSMDEVTDNNEKEYNANGKSGNDAIDLVGSSIQSALFLQGDDDDLDDIDDDD